MPDINYSGKEAEMNGMRDHGVIVGLLLYLLLNGVGSKGGWSNFHLQKMYYKMFQILSYYHFCNK